MSRWSLALVQPVGVEMAGAVVTADEWVLSVRWPIWLADDEREPLTAELRAFVVAAVEAVQWRCLRTLLCGYGGPVWGPWGLSRVLGCSWARAVAPLAGWGSWALA